MASTPNSITPFRRFLRLLLEDRRELFGVTLYALLNSLLLLAVPLVAQGLVNVTAAGLAFQPLLVLAVALMFGLLFAGCLTCLRFWLAEFVMQRIFCRVAMRVADALPVVKSRHLLKSGGPELMNRFFDVVNIQKSWFKLVYDGPGSILEIVIGLALLSVYGMELFLTGTIVVVTGAVIVALSGLGGLRSSLEESEQKYRVAEWLEEMVRCQDSLRLNCRPDFWTEEADQRVVAYLTERRDHFRVLLRQVSLHYFLSAVGLAGMLGLGGYLVLSGRLSLGQLVAAELVVWSLFKAAEKLLRTCEAYFDLLTGLHKVGYITDLPEERPGVVAFSCDRPSVEVQVSDLSYSYSRSQAPLLHDISFTLKPGERVAVLGGTGAGKSTLMRLLAGYLQPHQGQVELDLVDLREMSPESKNRTIGYLSERNELFAGSILDNVATGRECDLRQTRELLLKTGGRGALKRSVGGELDSLTSGGSTLSAGEAKSVLLSRTLLGRPRLLLLDDSLAQLSEDSIEKLLDSTFRAEDRPTVVCSAPLPQIVAECDRILLLQDRTLSAQGCPFELANDLSSPFTQTYPALARSLRAAKKTEAPDA